jgi:Domain of unknown function (DUF4150)
MAQTVFANCRGIADGSSNGMSIAFPDVCLTPSPAGPIPIPYPNIARSADVTGGPTSVKVDGAMPATKGAQYSKSSGDEAGVSGGVASGCNMGAAEFMLYSFDVKFDGQNVCRLGDMLFHNKKNTVG